MNKRSFILLLFMMNLAVAFAGTPLVILHTNDTHSQLEPYGPDEKYNAGKAGIVRREALVRQIRAESPNVLVLDAGDFVQGTPYFNMFKGEAEINLLNEIRPDAITLGNHEFDNGLSALAVMLKKKQFPVICTNYDVSRTALRKLVKPWLVICRGGLRIGIVSANVSPFGLIATRNFEGMTYLAPYEAAESRAAWLKDQKKCDVVICLSHLGYDNEGKSPDDLHLAEKSRNIDVIIGGHSHTFLKTPTLKTNQNGDTVIINQVGKGGIYVGRLDLMVEKK
jgi:5'-nucleotidase